MAGSLIGHLIPGSLLALWGLARIGLVAHSVTGRDRKKSWLWCDRAWWRFQPPPLVIVGFAAVGIALEAGYMARWRFVKTDVPAACERLTATPDGADSCPIWPRRFLNTNNLLHSLVYLACALPAACALALQRASRGALAPPAEARFPLPWPPQEH